MTLQQFVKTPEWSEIKEFLKGELVNKPQSFKTKDKTAERIALEVVASEMAAEKILKTIKKIERLGGLNKVEAKPFR